MSLAFKKNLAAALAALVLSGAAISVSAPAQAFPSGPFGRGHGPVVSTGPHHHGGYYWNGGWGGFPDHRGFGPIGWQPPHRICAAWEVFGGESHCAVWRWVR